MTGFLWIDWYMGIDDWTMRLCPATSYLHALYASAGCVLCVTYDGTRAWPALVFSSFLRFLWFISASSKLSKGWDLQSWVLGVGGLRKDCSKDYLGWRCTDFNMLLVVDLVSFLFFYLFRWLKHGFCSASVEIIAAFSALLYWSSINYISFCFCAFDSILKS